jgi:hypothetical protein
VSIVLVRQANLDRRRGPSAGLVFLVALLTVLGSSCGGRNETEQKWYDHGYEFIDGVIEVDNVHDRDELMRECEINATLLEVDDAAWDAMEDGCWDRAFEEDAWD